MATTYCSSTLGFNFHDFWFPFLDADQPFFLIVVRVYSMDLHFDPHSLQTLVSTSIVILSCQTSLSAFPFVYPCCRLLIPHLHIDFFHERRLYAL